MKTVLLTGGLGYIPSHVAVALLEAGYRVVLVDNLANSHESALENIKTVVGPILAQNLEFVFCDLAGGRDDLVPFRSCFSVFTVDAVIHLAAYKSVPESLEKPVEYYHNNLGSLINVIQVMQEAQVYKLLFSSSACVYGSGNQVPVGTRLTEADTATPLNPYGQTKAMGEQICRDVAKVWAPTGGCIMALRFANPVSSHPSHLLAENPRGPAMNLYNVISEVLAGKREKLMVFGTDYPTRDGSGERDFISVVDVAEAHVALVGKMIESPSVTGPLFDGGFKVVNIGTGRGTTVLEMVKLLEKKHGKTIPYEVRDRRHGDAASVVVDAEEIFRLVGWRAKRGLDQ